MGSRSGTDKYVEAAPLSRRVNLICQSRRVAASPVEFNQWSRKPHSTPKGCWKPQTCNLAFCNLLHTNRLMRWSPEGLGWQLLPLLAVSCLWLDISAVPHNVVVVVVVVNETGNFRTYLSVIVKLAICVVNLVTSLFSAEATTTFILTETKYQSIAVFARLAKPTGD